MEPAAPAAAEAAAPPALMCSHPGCGKVFTQARNLRRHEKQHTGQKEFVCDAPDCGKAFFRKSDLQTHKLCHSGAKPHTCQMCSRTFARISDLRLHERRHLSVKPFACEVCGRKFTRSYELHQHEKTHRHFGRDPAAPAALPRQPGEYLATPPDDGDDEHMHGAGCGHRVVMHEGHLDFLSADGHLHHKGSDGLLEVHTLTQPAAAEAELEGCGVGMACGIDGAHIHHDDHEHGDDCGHVAIRHLDHFDYLVDGQLHNTQHGYCEFHGALDVYPNTSGTSSSLDDLLQLL